MFELWGGDVGAEHGQTLRGNAPTLDDFDIAGEILDEVESKEAEAWYAANVGDDDGGDG